MLEKTLESPLDCKEIQPVHSKGLQSWLYIGRTIMKLKLQYFGCMMQKTDLFEKTPMLGKIEGRRRREWQRTKCLDGIINSTEMNLSQPQETVQDREAWHIADHGVTKSQTWLSDWMTTMVLLFVLYVFIFLQMCSDVFGACQLVQW